MPGFMYLVLLLQLFWIEQSKANLIPANYTMKAGCEAMLKGNPDCECFDQHIKCGMVTLDSNYHLEEISCKSYDARVLDQVPVFKAGNITKLIINNCAFPHLSAIGKVIKRLGITNYTQVEIENNFEQKDGRDEVLQQHYSTALPGFQKLSLLRFKSPLPPNYLENCNLLTHLHMRGSSDLPGTLLHPLGELTKLNILVKNMASVGGELFAKQTKLRRFALDCGLQNSSVEMSTLTSQELWHMTQLQIFELRNCGDNVPAELFWKSEKLESIAIQSNISYLGKDFLKAQKRLVMLKLSRNNIARLPDEIFYHTPRLLEIHLAFNNLERIQGGLFDKILNLQVLNLEHNPLANIASNAFSNLPKAHIYLGDFYKQWSGKDWAVATNATLCEEEYRMGVCLYCKREEYLDHFAEKEVCNKADDPPKEDLEVLRKYAENILKHKQRQQAAAKVKTT